MKYRVISSTDVREVQATVNQLLSEGWELRGDLVGVAGYAIYSARMYLQVMIKKEE